MPSARAPQQFPVATLDTWDALPHGPESLAAFRAGVCDALGALDPARVTVRSVAFFAGGPKGLGLGARALLAGWRAGEERLTWEAVFPPDAEALRRAAPAVRAASRQFTARALAEALGAVLGNIPGGGA